LDKENKTSPEPIRKLAAILFADIQGYTSLMQKDAKQASAILKRFHQIIEKEVNSNRGEIGNFYGDGALCIFETPGDAVDAAFLIQEAFTIEPVVPVRIGIHSGMVTLDGGKVYGDSVNLASRIESMGMPGSVLISKRVRDEIKNDPSLPLVSMGDFDFKNVTEPVSVYALNKDGLVLPSRKDLKGKFKENSSSKNNLFFKWGVLLIFTALAYAIYAFAIKEDQSGKNEQLPQKSIAILPFRDLSPERDQEYFADGIVEAIRSKLAQVGDLRVTSMTSVLIYRNNPKSISEIARELKVDHILEGTVFRADNKVRIIAQLIEAKTDEHLWVGTFDEEITDIFAIQSRIANNVADGMKATLTPEEKERIDFSTATDIKAYDLYLSASNDVRLYFDTRDTSYLWYGHNKLHKALEIDANYDQIYQGLARIWYIRSFTGYGAEGLDSAEHYIKKTLMLNPNNSDAFSLRANLLWNKGDFDGSKKEAEKALDLTPNDISAINVLADYYTSASEEKEKAIPYLLKAIVLSPVNSNNPEDNSAIYSRIGYLYMVTNQPEKAKEFYFKRYELFPENSNAIANMRLITAFTGQYSEAIKYSKIRVENAPNYLIALDSYGNDLIGLGRFEEALEVFEKMKGIVESNFEENSSTRSFRHRLGYVLWQLGRKDEAEELFKEYEKMMLDYIKDGTKVQGQEYDLAGIYAFTGQKEKAYEMLDKMPFWFVTNYLIKVDPLFDPIRNEPRFQQIIQKLDDTAEKMRIKLKEYESDGELAYSLSE
jgi:TolB-like protein/class 3 adenylate cyclase/Flp pilus assembly protein TadD